MFRHWIFFFTALIAAITLCQSSALKSHLHAVENQNYTVISDGKSVSFQHHNIDSHGKDLPAGSSSAPEKDSLNNRRSLDLPIERATRLPLIDIVSFADFFADGLIVDAGSPGFQMKIRKDEWEKPERFGDDRLVQQMAGKNARIILFLPDADAYVVQVRAKPGRVGQRLAFQIGDTKPSTLTLSNENYQSYWVDLQDRGNISGYRTLSIILDCEGPKPHFDFLRFKPITRFKPAPDLTIPPMAADQLPAFHGMEVPMKNTLILPGEGGIIYHLLIPPTTRLLWRLRFERESPGNDPIIFHIRVVCPGKPTRILFVEPLSEAFDQSHAVQAADLTEYAGLFVRLEFWASGGLPSDRLFLVEPLIENYMRPSGGRHSWIPPKNVIIYLSDTLRWDKVHFYKPDNNPIITPNFDYIARTGITFTNAISQGNWSKPSQAAIMTGRYPWDTNMQKPRDIPTADTLLIASAIKKSRPEVITGSYSSNGYVSNKFGFAQSWDYSRNMIREGKAHRTKYLFRAMFPVWEQDDNVNKPFFVWFGTIDPHVAYHPPKDFLRLYDPEPYNGFIIPWKTAYLLLDIRRGRVKLSDRDWHHLLSLYNGEVSYNDHELGNLLKKLEIWGIKEETAIILISDHGDEFLEHGGTGHGATLYDEAIRVPMIIYYPSGFPRPRVIEDAVETMSIYPTVLEMLGIEIPPETQAESLIPYAYGIGRLWQRLAVTNVGSRRFMASVGSWRFMVKGKKIKLFDNKKDPYQKNDLTYIRPDVVYYFMMRFADWCDRFELH